MSSRCERSRWKKLSYHQFSHVMTHPGIMRFCMHYVKYKLHRVESHLHFWRQEKLNRLPGGREGGREEEKESEREGGRIVPPFPTRNFADLSDASYNKPSLHHFVSSCRDTEEWIQQQESVYREQSNKSGAAEQHGQVRAAFYRAIFSVPSLCCCATTCVACVCEWMNESKETRVRKTDGWSKRTSRGRLLLRRLFLRAYRRGHSRDPHESSIQSIRTMSQCLSVDCHPSRKRFSFARDASPWKIAPSVLTGYSPTDSREASAVETCKTVATRCTKCIYGIDKRTSFVWQDNGKFFNLCYLESEQIRLLWIRALESWASYLKKNLITRDIELVRSGKINLIKLIN